MKPIYLLTCTALAALSLASCSPDRGTNYEPGGSSQALLESEGSWTIVEEQTETPPDQMHMNARSQVNPSQEVADADQYTEHFQPADLNEDTRYRVLRLEKRVDGIDNNFKQLLPPLKKLIVPGDELGTAINDIEARQDMQDLTPKITEKIVKTDYISTPPAKSMNTAPVIMQMPTAQKPVATAAPTPMPAIAGGTSIMNIRSGEHAGKTRLVLDANGPVTYKYDVDNNEKLLLIELTNVVLSAPMQKGFGNSAFLKSYTAQANGSNVTLAIELKQGVKVLSAAALPPGPENTNHRVFFDIGAP
ncbi:MAG: AMIN domain-containing protein [Alphaproteobacteria bacterium]